MKFLSKKICADDLFEGKSHKGIAQKIAHILRGDECKIIGIDGEWGSGKSNLVSLIQKQLNDTTITVIKKSFEFGLYEIFYGEQFLKIFIDVFVSVLKHFIVFFSSRLTILYFYIYMIFLLYI